MFLYEKRLAPHVKKGHYFHCSLFCLIEFDPGLNSISRKDCDNRNENIIPEEHKTKNRLR